MRIDKRHAMLGIGLVVTGVFLYFSMRHVQWAEFGKALGQFHYIWLLPAFLTFYSSMYLRAVRWGLLFKPEYELKGYQVFKPLMICFGFNNLFPGRVGEFARAIYVGKREKTGVSMALATVVAERIMDGLTLLGFLAVSLWMLPPMDKSLTYHWGTWTLNADKLNQLTTTIIEVCVVLTVGVICCMIPWVQRMMIKIIERLPLLGERGKGALIGIFNKFVQGFTSLRDPWVLAQVIFHSLLLWWLVGVSNWMVARGFGLPVNLPQAMALMTIVGVFIMIPAAPGYWGLYEAGVIFTLLILGIEKDPSKALAYALMMHMLQYLPIVILALIFAWQSQIRPTAIADAADDAATAAVGPGSGTKAK